MPNVSRFRHRDVGTVIEVKTVDEVVDLVKQARVERRTIFPVSTGMNWGFGSREPVRDVDIVVDLGRLDSIRLVDGHHGFAIVEPGVTQAQLARALVGTDYIVNLTASSAHTSVLGNALDRGVGVHRQRDADLVGVEVVTGAGQLARIGYVPKGDDGDSGYVHSVGPNALGLFVQSNLGVVTAGTIRLIRRQPSLRVLRLLLADADLETAIPSFRAWQDEGLLTGIVKIYDGSASRAYGSTTAHADHAAYVCLSGGHDFVDAKERILRERSTHVLGRWDTLHETSPGLSACEAMLVHCYAGDPSMNDAQVRAAFGASAREVDSQNRWGWLFFCSMVPTHAASVRRARQAVISSAPPEDALIGHTINILPGSAIDLVTSIKFGLQDGAAARAHRFLDRLHAAFIALGFNPYRLDIDHMTAARAIRTDAGQEDMLLAISERLDPASIVAPGRYLDKSHRRRGHEQEGLQLP